MVNSFSALTISTNSKKNVFDVLKQKKSKNCKKIQIEKYANLIIFTVTPIFSLI